MHKRHFCSLPCAMSEHPLPAFGLTIWTTITTYLTLSVDSFVSEAPPWVSTAFSAVGACSVISPLADTSAAASSPERSNGRIQTETRPSSVTQCNCVVVLQYGSRIEWPQRQPPPSITGFTPRWMSARGGLERVASRRTSKASVEVTVTMLPCESTHCPKKPSGDRKASNPSPGSRSGTSCHAVILEAALAAPFDISKAGSDASALSSNSVVPTASVGAFPSSAASVPSFAPLTATFLVFSSSSPPPVWAALQAHWVW
mmetsp:Transcript_48203/g.127651  ORF Transcript_48203/g.127651 Transcript_48203/m.127651 type:complete len:258 (+) Transcript_48203:217-990(+)